MSYEIPESPEPILDLQLPSDLKQKFRVLFFDAYELYEIHENDDDDLLKEAAASLHQSVKETLAEFPVLAQTIFKNMQKYSLLEVFCRNVGDVCYDSIQLIIESNPHALLWSSGLQAPIYCLASSGWGCKLMPWIAQRYPWIFRHSQCQHNPPHLLMMACYVSSQWDLEPVRNFYEIYPQGLRERYKFSSKGYPLSASLHGWREPDADFFIWMAKQYPKAAYYDQSRARSVLHEVCRSLASKSEDRNKCTPNMARICRFLISEHPDLAIEIDGYMMPISLLMKSCNRPLVQEMAILLLKAYPQCMQVEGRPWCPELSGFPFIQKIQPLVFQDVEIDRELSLLAQVLRNMKNATILSAYHSTSTPEGADLTLSVLNSLNEVYRSWARLRIKLLKTQKQCLKEHIEETCIFFRDDDASDEESSDESDSSSEDDDLSDDETSEGESSDDSDPDDYDDSVGFLRRDYDDSDESEDSSDEDDSSEESSDDDSDDDALSIARNEAHESDDGLVIKARIEDNAGAIEETDVNDDHATLAREAKNGASDKNDNDKEDRIGDDVVSETIVGKKRKR